TSGHGFVTRLIIDRLSQAKQRTPLIERLARREHESASWSDRRLAERHCGIDQLRFLADGSHLFGFTSRCRLQQCRRLFVRDRRAVGGGGRLDQSADRQCSRTGKSESDAWKQ